MRIHGKRVVVVGMGRTGMALARLLQRAGAAPFVSEQRDGPALEPFMRELEEWGVPYECGGHSEAAFERAALIIPSPGVSPRIDPIRRARARGVEVVGEMEFAFAHCTSKILAVTGTNGKTTTTELVRAMVERCGRTVGLAGNNAVPFSLAVTADPQPEYLVLEVSSYQLETMLRFRPWIGCVLNVTPDHLARHPTMGEYASMKARLFANQLEDDHAVLNADDFCVREMAVDGGGRRWVFSCRGAVGNGLYVAGDAIRSGSEEIARVADVRLPGRHNLENALAALTMMEAGGFRRAAVVEALREFKGVEHRIERVTTIDGVTYYNDSKSTNLDSLRVALESFDRPVVLIAGGQGKGDDYLTLRPLVSERVGALVVIGEDAAKIEEAYGDLVATCRASDMNEAVVKATERAEGRLNVLLSPGCASFDMFENFEHRGRVFKECVRELARIAGVTSHGVKRGGRYSA